MSVLLLMTRGVTLRMRQQLSMMITRESYVLRESSGGHASGRPLAMILLTSRLMDPMHGAWGLQQGSIQSLDKHQTLQEMRDDLGIFDEGDDFANMSFEQQFQSRYWNPKEGKLGHDGLYTGPTVPVMNVDLGDNPTPLHFITIHFIRNDGTHLSFHQFVWD